MLSTTIDKVVRAAIAEQGYKNLRKYLLFLHFAFDALYKLKRDNVIVSFRSISLPIVDGRATIPDTVLAMGQIGWQRGQYISPAISAPNMSMTVGASGGEFNGMGGWGKYHIDRSVVPAQIIFDVAPAQAEVYVEVIDQVLTPTTETLVPHEAVLPMKSYIAFRHARFKTGAASAEARQAELEYMDEHDEAMAGLSDLSGAGIWFALSQKELRSRMGLEYPFLFGG